MKAVPLYAFGFGLSYTTFHYDNLRIEKRGANRFHVTFDVTNTGDRDGEEVAQLYSARSSGIRSSADTAIETLRTHLHIKGGN